MTACVTAVLPLKQSQSGGSGSFLVRADDGERYWCKTLNNQQHPRVPINEQIVARLGRLIGAAVCEPRLVQIPSDLVGWEFRPGRFLEEGWAHGGREIDGCVETRALEHRSESDNAVRHVGFYAVHDWLGGQDQQWLYTPNDGFRYYSHDHGHYFWGPAWTTASLAANEAAPAPLAVSPAGLDSAEIDRMGGVIDTLQREDLEGALANLPATWPIDQVELDAVIDFSIHRCAPVAQRLRALA